MISRSIISPVVALSLVAACCTTQRTSITATVASWVVLQLLCTPPPVPASVVVPQFLMTPAWCQDMKALFRKGHRLRSHHQWGTSTMIKLKGGPEVTWSQVDSAWPRTTTMEKTKRKNLQKRSRSSRRISAMPTWRTVSDTFTLKSNKHQVSSISVLSKLQNKRLNDWLNFIKGLYKPIIWIEYLSYFKSFILKWHTKWVWVLVVQSANAWKQTANVCLQILLCGFNIGLFCPPTCLLCPHNCMFVDWEGYWRTHCLIKYENIINVK